MKRLTFTAIVLMIIGCGNQPVDSAERPAPSTETAASKARQSPPGIGKLAPDFTLADKSGRPITLSAARGKKVVLAFYRGYW